MLANIFRAQTRAAVSRSWATRLDSIQSLRLLAHHTGRSPRATTLRNISSSFPRRQEETPPLDPTLPHLSEVQKEIERTKPRTLFIGNLPLRTTKEDVQRLFANYGDVFVRMRLTHRGACTGFVHVVFPSEDIAQQVLRETEVKPLMIGKTTLRVAPSKGVSDALLALRDLPPSRTLFLGGLPPDAGASDVQELFSTTTGMEVVRLASRHDGSCAGFAHIDFTSVAEAENVIQAHISSPLKLGDHILRLAYAEPEELRNLRQKVRTRNRTLYKKVEGAELLPSNAAAGQTHTTGEEAPKS